jgi:hypothetical protein
VVFSKKMIMKFVSRVCIQREWFKRVRDFPLINEFDSVSVTLPLSAIAFFFVKEAVYFIKNRNGSSPMAKVNISLEKMSEILNQQLMWQEKHSLHHNNESDRIKELAVTVKDHEEYEERMLNEIKAGVEENRAALRGSKRR